MTHWSSHVQDEARLAGDVLHERDGTLADERGTGWERTPWHATQRAVLLRSHDCRVLEIDISRGVDPKQSEMRELRQSRSAEKF